MKGDIPDMERIVEKVQKNYKAITAFALTFAPFLTATIADPDIAAALPEGAGKWLTVVGIPAVVAVGTWLKRNEPTLQEAEEILARAQDRAGVAPRHAKSDS